MIFISLGLKREKQHAETPFTQTHLSHLCE